MFQQCRVERSRNGECCGGHATSVRCACDSACAFVPIVGAARDRDVTSTIVREQPPHAVMPKFYVVPIVWRERIVIMVAAAHASYVGENGLELAELSRSYRAPVRPHVARLTSQRRWMSCPLICAAAHSASDGGQAWRARARPPCTCAPTAVGRRPRRAGIAVSARRVDQGGHSHRAEAEGRR